MIDLKRFRQDPAGFRRALLRREDPSAVELLARLEGLDRSWRGQLTALEQLKATRNAASEEVARRKKAGTPAADLLAELKTSSERAKQLEADVRGAEAELERVAAGIPNLPHGAVPDGGADRNRLVRAWGEPPSPAGPARPHWELGEALGLFDLPRGAKVTGSGFPVYTGMGARLIRALTGFMIDLHVREHGYLEVAPPYLVNRAALTGTGQLPKFEEDMYGLPADDLFLIPTAEVPLTNLHREEILDPGRLPIAYVSYSPCFRREAFAHGKDTRGLIRLHQFDKVELVRLVAPASGDSEHEILTRHAEAVLQRLELPYRVVELAAGDTGFSAARTYDLEVWAPGVGAWLEVSSSSTFTDFQARRASIRYRPTAGARPELVHTLNASGVAFPRTIIGLLETHQAADGSIRIPAALAPYLGTDRLGPGR